LKPLLPFFGSCVSAILPFKETKTTGQNACQWWSKLFCYVLSDTKNLRSAFLSTFRKIRKIRFYPCYDSGQVCRGIICRLLQEFKKIKGATSPTPSPRGHKSSPLVTNCSPGR
jgi:hypothetical protein